MSREFKFRVWDKLNLIYVYVTLEELLNDGSYRGNLLITDEWEQYTGLKDKKGVEIYEGDIIKIKDELDPTAFYKGSVYEYFKEVKYIGTRFDFGFEKGYLREYQTTFEVVGNIHENNGLLK